MPSFENGTNGSVATPKITLYTNHRCPYAHRAHITLRELDLPYEEVIVDLDKPREQWYLDINPRGLVPSIKYTDGTLKEEIITESQVVAQFLADSKPSHLAPSPQSSPKAALFRARLNFFMDTWNTKLATYMFSILKLDDMNEKETKCNEWAAAIQKEFSPLLADADPFFGGSKEFTLAEVHAAPFLLRVYAMSNGEFLPASFRETLNSIPNFGRWAQATISHKSVLEIWDEQDILSNMRKLMAKFKAAQNK